MRFLREQNGVNCIWLNDLLMLASRHRISKLSLFYDIIFTLTTLKMQNFEIYLVLCPRLIYSTARFYGAAV